MLIIIQIHNQQTPTRKWDELHHKKKEIIICGFNSFPKQKEDLWWLCEEHVWGMNGGRGLWFWWEYEFKGKTKQKTKQKQNKKKKLFSKKHHMLI